MTAVVVTGGAGGIGGAIVDRLSRDGKSVIVVDRMSPQQQPPAVTFLEGSAADERTARDAVSLAREAGGLQGWVNCAADFMTPSLHGVGTSEWMEPVVNNLTMAAVGCRAAIQEFVRAGAGGAIVNMSSHQSTRAVRGGATYATSKAAIDGLTRALAVDYGPFGIRINGVAPGTVETARLSELRDRRGIEIDAHVRRLHPLGRSAQAAEVAAVVAFLLSDDAGYMNGAVIPVDGGRSARGDDPEESASVL